MSTKEIIAELGKLDQANLAKFVDELQKHRQLSEDLYDLLVFKMRASEPVRPFEDFARELQHNR